MTPTEGVVPVPACGANRPESDAPRINAVRRDAVNSSQPNPEVRGGLVPPSVFKTDGPYVNHAADGFDSHALPLFLTGQFWPPWN